MSIAHEIDAWRGFEHEDLAAFAMICRTAAIAPLMLFGDKGIIFDDWDEFEFRRWCNMSGTDSRKLRKAATAITDAWTIFCKVNKETDQFSDLFGQGERRTLASLPWQMLINELAAAEIHRQLITLPGVTEIAISANDAGGYSWQDSRHDHSGQVLQDDTPIRLGEGTYVARLVPSREAKEVVTTWRLAHLGK